MKRLFTYLMLLSTGLLFSCDKDDSPVLGDPDVRLDQTLSDYKNTLISAPHGWKATIYPAGGGGYSFYFQFGADDRVTMLSDFNSETAGKSANSSYRLKALQRPTLIFDTYSYIHLLSDPDEKVNGGTRGKGLTSDFEFAFTSVTTDQIKLEGTFNKSEITLIKVTEEEAQSYVGGQIKQLRDATAQYLSVNRYPYLQFSDERKLSLSIDVAKKVVTLSYVDDIDNNNSSSSPFSFTLNGILLKNPLSYGGIKFQELIWDNAEKQYYMMLGNERENVQNSPTPVIPLRTLFGYAKDYSIIEFDPTKMSDNLSPDFYNRFYQAKAGLAAVGNNAGRNLVNVYFIFTSRNEITIRYRYHNTAGTYYNADYLYDATIDPSGIVSLVLKSQNGNANTAGPGIVALTDYFKNNTFKIDWVADPASTSPLGGLYKAGDTTSFFYGSLVK